MGKTLRHLMAGAASLTLLLAAGTADAQSRKRTPAPKPAATQPAPAPVRVSPPSAAKHGVGKGDSEFGVFGVLSTYDDQDLDLLTVGATFGSFLSDSFELRVTPVVSLGDAAGNTIVTIAPFISGEFVFRAGPKVAPFVGGGIGFQFLYIGGDPAVGDTYGVGVGLGPTGGVKFFVTERMALELALTYQVGYITLFDEVTTSNSGDYNELRQDLRVNFYY